MVDLCPYNWRQWSPGQYTQEFLHFLEQFCATRIDDIMNELDTTSSYGVPIDMLELINFNNQLGDLSLLASLDEFIQVQCCCTIRCTCCRSATKL